jgi:hypothetical protein
LQFEGSGRYSPALQGVPGTGISDTAVTATVVVEGRCVVVVVGRAVVVVVGRAVVVMVGRKVVVVVVEGFVVVVGGCHHGGLVVVGLEVEVVVGGGCHHGGVAVDTVGLVVAELELVVQSGHVVDDEAGTSYGGVELISPTTKIISTHDNKM